ncbi:MAG: MarR family winged helix-turn-helix transcriptional regulator [Streptomycetales bacterium]
MRRTSDDLTAGYLLWRTMTKWRAAADQALSPLGLTHAQYTLLASLYGMSRTGAKPSQRGLADFAGLEPIYVSKLARALEQGGLLTRTGHPADPRAVQLTLTDPGVDVAQRAIDVIGALQEKLTAPIGGTTSRQSRQLVHTLKTLLGITPPSGGAAENVHETRSNTMTQTQTQTQTATQTAVRPALTGQDIAEAQGALRAVLDEALAKTGTSSNGYVILRVLALRGPAESPAAFHGYLAGQRQLGLDRSGVAVLLSELEAEGLISGTPAEGPGPVQLTEQGAAVHASLADSITPITKRIFDGLDPDDLAVAHRVLTQLTQQAEQVRDTL